MRKKHQYLIAATLIVVGSNIFTYAATRQWTTKLVLTRSTDTVEQFLVERNLFYGPGNHATVLPQGVYSEGKQLLGRVGEAGGMYHWGHDSLLYLGLGVFLVLVGLLVPFVGPRREVASDGKA